MLSGPWPPQSQSRPTCNAFLTCNFMHNLISCNTCSYATSQNTGSLSPVLRYIGSGSFQIASIPTQNVKLHSSFINHLTRKTQRLWKVNRYIVLFYSQTYKIAMWNIAETVGIEPTPRVRRHTIATRHLYEYAAVEDYRSSTTRRQTLAATSRGKRWCLWMLS